MYEPEFLPVVTETRKAKDEIKRAKEEEARRKANEEADDSSAMTLLLEEEKEETIKKAMLSENGHSQLPIVPPKALKAEIKEEEDEVWFFVQSPREQHGAVGPFLVDELRSYRRLGKLHDTTLMWTAEFTNWKPLGTITTLKNKLLTLPPIPKRLSPDKKIDDPIVDIPAILNKNECEKLEVREKFSPSMMCCRCGSTAVTHLPETGEQRPDFKVLRQTIGNFQDASEVIPGLLWIGNASTGRSKFFIKYGFDLSINCTDTLKTPESKPPHYRCKTIPFKEERSKEKDNESNRSSRSLHTAASTLSSQSIRVPPTLEETLEYFDIFYDMVEIARISPERLQEEDLKPPDYRGGLDRYGRPLRSKEEAALWKATNKNKGQSDRHQFNILAWSRLGFDRPCAATVAYLLRKWGLSLDYALDIVSIARIGTNISAHYMEALEVYSLRHSLGDMLCTECTVSGLTKNDRSSYQHMKISGMQQLLPEADKAVFNSIRNAAKPSKDGSTPDFSVLMEKIVHIKSSFTLHRGYANQPRLMELRLPGRSFSDEDMANLSLLLTKAGVLPQICLLDLSTNNIESAGIKSLCDALCAACPAGKSELTSLWLQHNKIGPEGGEAIALLLHPGYMLHTLNVEDNLLGDVGVGTITLSLIVPERDLFEDNEEEPDISHLPQDVLENVLKQQQKQAEEDARYVGNQTITSLNISNNNFGRETMDNVAQIFKTNKVLKKLNMDCILIVKPKDIANFINCCKVYNKTLTELTLTDTFMPASVVGMLFKVLNSNSILSRLSLARCGLTDLHVLRGLQLLGTAKHVTHLNLSGNPLSDSIIPALCVGIEGQIDRESGRHLPPLQHLDLSASGLTLKGALQLVKTVGGRSCVKHLDLSNNDLSPSTNTSSDQDMQAFAEGLQMSALHTINLNCCRLGTKFTQYILLALKSTDERLCGFHLRKLLLSENDIHDSIDQSLYQFLSDNTQIQLLDIGFNKLTEAGLEVSKKAILVTSTSADAKKLHELHVNLLGNPCEKSFLLDYPGMARSKVTLRLGHETRHDAMEHIQTELRDHYIDRRNISGKLQIDLPTSHLVKFNDCS